MPKKIITLAAILVGLSALSAYLIWHSNQSSSQNKKPLEGFSEKSIVKFMMQKQGQLIVLEKTGDQWKITSPIMDDADSSMARDWIASLMPLSLGSEVSRDPNFYASYEVNEASATRVRLFAQGDPGPILDAYFGKAALGPNSLYFRNFRDAPVYLATGIDSYQLNHNANDFRQKTLNPFESGLVESIILDTGKKHYELKKSSTDWTSANPELKPDQLSFIASTLLNIRATDFVIEANTQTGLDQPLLTVELSYTNKHTTWKIGKLQKADKGQKPAFRYAQVEGRNAILLVSTWDIDNILDRLSGKSK